MKSSEQKKLIHIKVTILAVHLIFVLGFALLIKDLIIKDIDSYYSLITDKYYDFTGKSMKSSVVTNPSPVGPVVDAN